jgi:hypothetical protein
MSICIRSATLGAFVHYPIAFVLMITGQKKNTQPGNGTWLIAPNYQMWLFLRNSNILGQRFYGSSNTRNFLSITDINSLTGCPV